MATYAIGDVHGCREELELLLSAIYAEDPDAYVVTVGDYVDRGPDSKGVIELLMREQQSKAGRFVCLKGNHEDMLLAGILNYADETLKSYGATKYEDVVNRLNIDAVGHVDSYAVVREVIPRDHIEWMTHLPFMHETDEALFVHGGFSPARPLSEQTEEICLRYRHTSVGEDFDFGKHTYHGHTPQKGILTLRHRTNVDTGCVYNGALTAARVGSDGRPDKFLVIEKGSGVVRDIFPYPEKSG